MSDAMDVARRAVACRRWRWMSGMLSVMPGVDVGRVLLVGDWVHVSWDSELPAALCGPGEILPDLTDPATLGCLLALVREAWNDPRLRTEHDSTYGDSYGWRVMGGDDDEKSSRCITEAWALVYALEAAP